MSTTARASASGVSNFRAANADHCRSDIGNDRQATASGPKSMKSWGGETHRSVFGHAHIRMSSRARRTVPGGGSCQNTVV
jgi:hypothetical protein